MNVTANATYNLGDKIHFEAKTQPCIPTYGLDGTTIVERGGWTGLIIRTSMDSNYMLSNRYISVIDGGGYSNVHDYINSTLDHSTISGYIDVTGKLLAGEHYLRLLVGRDGDSTRYYTDKFILE